MEVEQVVGEGKIMRLQMLKLAKVAAAMLS